MAVICIRNITGIPDIFLEGGGRGVGEGAREIGNFACLFLRTSACYQKPCHNIPSGWKCVTYFYVSFIFPYLQLHINPDTVE